MPKFSNFDFMIVGPGGAPDPSLAIAGSRSGAIGVLNLEFATDGAGAVAAYARLAALGRGRIGVLVDGSHSLLGAILGGGARNPDVVLLAGFTPDALHELLPTLAAEDITVAVVARTVDEARRAEAAGADAIIAKGHEAGGWAGEEGAFVLLQRLRRELRTPVWVQGGVGLHTAAACAVAGAAGAVLDSQVLLARESPLSEAVRKQLLGADGSETACVGDGSLERLRIYSRPGLPPVTELRRVATGLALDGGDDDSARQRWRLEARRRVDWQGQANSVLAVGQDIAFAAELARRFHTVGGIVAALTGAMAGHCRTARDRNPLVEHGPLARSHGTRYPLVQGPMTRVSDTAAFADAVSEAGALPFLALALMRAPEVASLLEDAQRRLAGRAWGVGVLGFVPAELRAEQLEVIERFRPGFALIAGGRPDQAAHLEARGIPTYLHVPSPGLLRIYLKDGAKRFVFEGRECGGHVGPRTSFVLWETMVSTLLEEVGPDADASAYHLLFAGGIHDGVSAAMVAATAAPLADRGMSVGALLGTAYLFTEEAVRAGAITPGFQAAAVSCQDTVLLESGPGHATRCLPSPFVEDFTSEKLQLAGTDLGPEEVRDRLEALNIGRLRIAAKGTDRHPRYGHDPAAPKLVDLGPEEQWRRGMYMIGQVAALRDRVCTLAELHHEVSAGGVAHLESLALPDPDALETAGEPVPPPADVAIVGMGAILPGAPDLQAYWANILDKVDAVQEVPATRWDWRRYFDPDRSAKDKVYSRWGGFVDDVAFDPVAFGMPPNSLPSIEPFHLLGLLVAKAALADAGYLDRDFPRLRTSVIMGAGGGGADLGVGYTVRSTLPQLFGDSAWALTEKLDDALPEWTEDSFPGVLMNVAAGRIANRLDLGGLNYTVDAACASSLAAVSLGVRELQAGTADVVIAGGVDAIQTPFAFLCFSKTQALSPSGRCRPFDAEADGIAISEGFGALILKRRVDAERDGDRIYALIQGVGGSSDGRDRSLTAPRPEGQMRALRRAYAHAGVSPSTVGLVEAHGTGTVAGDRAEVRALSTVFSEAGAARQRCALGSVKSMIGHTKATAGVAGLIKAALALHHRVLPPTLGVTAPNPAANFSESPLYVNTEVTPWVHGDPSHPRRAGVSAFGFGGTNFHVVLEEYADSFLADQPSTLDRWPAELLVWRGRSRADILHAVSAVLGQLQAGARPALADLAHTLAVAADAVESGPATLAIVAPSIDDLVAKLETARRLLADDEERHHRADGIHYADAPLAGTGALAFLFPGQGSQRVRMAAELAVAFPEARTCFERADEVLAGCFDRPLSDFVFPAPAFGADQEKRQHAALTETNVAQPALAAADLAYLHVLRTVGVQPDMVAGHSFGELVALHAAGSLQEDDLFRLSEARGRFIREIAPGEGGAMAAVDAAPGALEALLAGHDVVLANLNAPEQTVVSGTRQDVDRAVAWCAEHGLRARVLPVAAAFHSPHVAAAQRRLADLLADTALTAPGIPVFSNTTAAPYPQDAAKIAELLGEHLVRPVQFVREVEAMHAAGCRIFLEVGPRTVLTGLVKQILVDRPHLCLALDRPGRPGLETLLDGLAAVAAEGVPVRTAPLFRGRSVRLLDLSALESVDARPQPSPTTWLVNGGRARPAREPGTDAAHPPLPVAVADGSAAQTASGAPAVPSQETPSAAPDGRTTPSPVSEVPGERTGGVSRMAPPVDAVMTKYHAVMQRFLGTQQAVMTTYLRGQAAAAGEAGPVDGTDAASQPPHSVDGHIGRFVVAATSAPAVAETGSLSGSGAVVVVDDGSGVGEELARRLRHAGQTTVRIVSRPGPTHVGDHGTAAADLRDPEAVALLVGHVSDRYGGATGLIHLSCLRPAPDVGPAPASVPGELVELFLLLKGFRADLDAAARAGGSAVLGATRSGGAFATDPSPPPFTPAHGAIAGFLKSVAKEWPAVRVKAVDLPAPHHASDADVAGWLHAELMAADGEVEVGYPQGRRTVVEPVPVPLTDRADTTPLDDSSVVLVTGGARGITAEAAVRLAERYRPTLVVVGRTPPGGEEPDTAGITDRAALKQVLMERRRRTGAPLALAAVEDDYRSLQAQREVGRNLDRIRATGARVEYVACDVRDAAAFAGLIDRLYATHGRLDGVIHGAGVVEDKLVADKELSSLERVVATKLAGAAVLAARLRPETLRFLVFFSSVSGRFGSRGQADYAAASEVLNKLAQQLDRQWPARVVSINWGPWLGVGMVSPEVQRQFADAGVELIPVDVGCRRLDEELRRGRKGEVEVVIAGAGQPTRSRIAPDEARPAPVDRVPEAGGRALPLLLAATPLVRSADGCVEVLRTFDPDHDYFLADHCMDGRPVVPFAVAMELMAEVAAAGWPGLEVAELRDVRLLRGITIAERPSPIRVLAVPHTPSGPGAPSGLSVDVTISSDGDQGRHYQATVELRPPDQLGGAEAPMRELGRRPLDGLAPPPLTVGQAYDSLLFHGRLFQGIAAIDGIGEGGARAVFRPSNPGRIVRCPLPADWLVDPVVVDCGLQMQVVWARLHWDLTLLPAELASYRRYASLPPLADGMPGHPASGEELGYELRIRPESRSPLCHADHAFFSADGRLLATLTDMVGAGSKALNRLAASRS